MGAAQEKKQRGRDRTVKNVFVKMEKMEMEMEVGGSLELDKD